MSQTLKNSEFTIDRIIGDYVQYSNLANDENLLVLPDYAILSSSMPRIMSASTFAETLTRLEYEQGINARDLFNRVIQFNQAYKNQVRTEALPMRRENLRSTLLSLARAVENYNGEFTAGEKQILADIKFSLEMFMNIESVNSDVTTSSTIQNAIAMIKHYVGEEEDEIDDDTDSVIIDPVTTGDILTGTYSVLVGRWQRGSMVIEFRYDTSLQTAYGVAVTQPGGGDFQAGDILWKNIQYDSEEDTKLGSHDGYTVTFKGEELYKQSGTTLQKPIFLDVVFYRRNDRDYSRQNVEWIRISGTVFYPPSDQTVIDPQTENQPDEMAVRNALTQAITLAMSERFNELHQITTGNARQKLVTFLNWAKANPTQYNIYKRGALLAEVQQGEMEFHPEGMEAYVWLKVSFPGVNWDKAYVVMSQESGTWKVADFIN
jgi:hypothetical protein